MLLFTVCLLVLDGINASRKSRANYIRLGHEHGYKIVAFWFNRSRAVCEHLDNFRAVIDLCC